MDVSKPCSRDQRLYKNGLIRCTKLGMDSNTTKRIKSYILLGKSSTNTDVSVYSSKYSLVIKQRKIVIPKFE